MIDITINLMFQGALVYWPNLTPEIFREAGQTIVSRLGPDGSASVEQMERLIRTELLVILGPPVIPFPVE